MKKTTLLCGALLFCGAVFAGPFCEWDFEKTDAEGKFALSADGKYKLRTRTLTDDGFKGKGAVLDGKTAFGLYFPAAKDWTAFTFEMKFKLSEGVDQKVGAALICYCKHDWNRSQFLLRITPKQQLEAKFNQHEPKGEFRATSKVLNFEPGKFYTVRVASQDGGALKIWLDGELVAVKEKDSWGFNRLTVKQKPKGNHLFFIVGRDMANPVKAYRPFTGIVDDLKIWNEFKEPDLLAETSAGNKTASVPLIAEKKSTSAAN